MTAAGSCRKRVPDSVLRGVAFRPIFRLKLVSVPNLSIDKNAIQFIQNHAIPVHSADWRTSCRRNTDCVKSFCIRRLKLCFFRWKFCPRIFANPREWKSGPKRCERRGLLKLGHRTGQSVEKRFVRAGSDRILLARIRGNSRANFPLRNPGLSGTSLPKDGNIRSFAIQVISRCKK